MMNSKRLALTLGAITIASVAAIAAVGAGYTLFGGASYVMPGNNSNRAVKLVSDGTVPSTPAAPYSGIDFAVASTLKFSDIQNLGTDYMFTAGSCGLGAPRFQINVGGVNAFVYIGPLPNYTGCPQNVWLNTGNLATPASFVDTSQLPGGTFYDTFAAADVKYGTMIVTGIQLVTDSGLAFPATGQTVEIDNTQINSTTYTYEPASKDDCKDGGWQNFTFAPGPFKNQGQCVSHFANGKP
jgi:hypothetical protein